MDIKKTSDTEWEIETPCGCGCWMNTNIYVEALKEGLQIESDIISWADIDEARNKLNQKD